MAARNQKKSKVEGLYKRCRHLSWDRCDCPWWGRVRGERVSLAKWSSQPVRSKEMAKEVLRRMEDAVMAGTFNPAGERVTVTRESRTFGMFLDDYIKSHVEGDDLKSNSVMCYMDVFRRAFGAENLSALAQDPGRFEVWLKAQHAERRWSNATYNRYLEHGRGMFNWAKARKLVTENPFDVLEPKSEHNRRERRISPEQERKLFDACTEMESKKHRQLGRAMRRRLIAAIDLGLRQGEMLLVQVKHIDFKDSVLRLPAGNTKAGKDQQVYVGTERCKKMLEERRFLGPDSYVFGTDEGDYVASFDRTWKKLFSLAGLPVGRKDGYVWHDLRHEFCSFLADQSAGVHELREMARHADIRTTMRYIKARDERLKELAGAFEKRQA